MRQLQVHLRAAQAQLALALPPAQVRCSDSASVILAKSLIDLAMPSHAGGRAGTSCAAYRLLSNHWQVGTPAVVCYPAPVLFQSHILVRLCKCKMHSCFHQGSTLRQQLRCRPAVGETVAVVAFARSIPSSGPTQWLSGPAGDGPWCPIAGALCSTYSPDPDGTGKWLVCRLHDSRGGSRPCHPSACPGPASARLAPTHGKLEPAPKLLCDPAQSSSAMAFCVHLHIPLGG